VLVNDDAAEEFVEELRVDGLVSRRLDPVLEWTRSCV
jgi:hypothetical protein